MALVDVVHCLRALADPARLRLLALCSTAPAAVSDLAAALGASEPTISRHLKLLATVGLVRRARRGQFVDYTLVTRGSFAALLEEALRGVPADDASLRRARQRLTQRASMSGAAASAIALRTSSPGVARESARMDAALAAAIRQSSARSLALRTAEDCALVMGRCPAHALQALREGHARILVAASGVAQRTAERRRLSDAGIAAQVVLRGDAARLLQGERIATVFVDATGDAGIASLESDLRWARSLLAGEGRCWVLADYDAFENGIAGASRAPPLELRARLEQQSYVAARIQPIEADGLHRLLADARLRTATRSQAA